MDTNERKRKPKKVISLLGLKSDNIKIAFNKIKKFFPEISIISVLFLFILNAFRAKYEKKLRIKKQHIILNNKF